MIHDSSRANATSPGCPSILATRIDVVVVWLGASVFLLLTAVSLVAFSGLIPFLRNLIIFFDVASEANLWTWANVIALAGASYAHFCAAYSRWWHRRPAVAGWLITATILAAMSLDDLASLHERLEPIGRTMGGGSGFLHFSWIVPGALLGVLVVVFFINLARTVDTRTCTLLIIGVGCFFSGAVGMEAIGGYVLSTQGHNRLYVLLFHVEEFLEAIGAIFLLSAALADLPLRDPTLNFFLARPRD